MPRKRSRRLSYDSIYWEDSSSPTAGRRPPPFAAARRTQLVCRVDSCHRDTKGGTAVPKFPSPKPNGGSHHGFSRPRFDSKESVCLLFLYVQLRVMAFWRCKDIACPQRRYDRHGTISTNSLFNTTVKHEEKAPIAKDERASFKPISNIHCLPSSGHMFSTASSPFHPYTMLTFISHHPPKLNQGRTTTV